MSKGSKQRPALVTDEQLQDSWDKIFNDKSKTIEKEVDVQQCEAPLEVGKWPKEK